MNPWTRTRRALSDDGGFSLVELVAAMVVLGLMSVGIISVILNSQSQGLINRNRVAASNLAAREVDLVREQFTRDSSQPQLVADAGTVVNPHPLPGQTAGLPLVIDGTRYTVTRTSSWNVTGAGVTACDGGALVLYPTLKVVVTVTWPNMRSAKPVRSSAVLAPNKNDKISGTSGFVAVKVTKSTGQPQPGVSVIVTAAGETRNVTTDSSGCAVAQVSPAAGAGTSYAAKLSNPGFVDLAGNATPSKAVGVVARGALNNGVTFAYDAAVTLRLRFVDGAGNPVADAAVVGGSVSVVSSTPTGGSDTKVLSITSALMDVPGLWPTQYGAYFGTAPSAPYTPVSPAAGTTTIVNVKVTP